MNPDIYFISDAHLGGADRKAEHLKASKLISFFKEIQSAAHLYIIGDLFDFWFEYRSVISNQHPRVLGAIADLVDRGTKVDYVAGNHDFWFGDFLSAEIGLAIHLDPLIVEHQGLKIYIAHGDGVAQGDRGYRVMRRILRNRVNIRLYRLIHPDIGLPLARKISALSRSRVDDEFRKSFQDYENFAREKINHGINAVILAHTHQPILCRIGQGVYLNVGDWMRHFTYGRLYKGNLTLEKW